jgi:hypothetical protein
MRFNDGFWLLKNGVKSYYGLQATQIKEKDGAFELVVATRPIRHRGDTLGGTYNTSPSTALLMQSPKAPC